MGYNKFRWWTNGRKKKLSVKKPLIERINNGDFDYSHYYSEEKAARKQSSDLYNEIMSKCPEVVTIGVMNMSETKDLPKEC